MVANAKSSAEGLCGWRFIRALPHSPLLIGGQNSDPLRSDAAGASLRLVYPNLAGQMALTGINQLWVADITYIRLETEFVYLAVVIDAFSRRKRLQESGR